MIVALLGVMQVRWSARMSDICELHTFTGPVRRVAFSDVPEGAARRYLIKHLLQQLLTPRKICFSSETPAGKSLTVPAASPGEAGEVHHPKNDGKKVY